MDVTALTVDTPLPTDVPTLQAMVRALLVKNQRTCPANHVAG